MGGFVARGVWMLTVVALLFLIPASSPVVSGDFKEPDRDWVERRIREMTLEQKVGQMFMVGFGNPGDQPAYEINDQSRTYTVFPLVGNPLTVWDKLVVWEPRSICIPPGVVPTSSQ